MSANRSKKTFVKPKVVRVSLNPEEAVLWGCKAVAQTPIALIEIVGQCTGIATQCLNTTS